MLLSYVIAFDQLIQKSRRRHDDAFADPLDAPEWRAFAPILEWIAGFRTRRRIKQERAKQSETDDCARNRIPACRSVGEPAT